MKNNDAIKECIYKLQSLLDDDSNNTIIDDLRTGDVCWTRLYKTDEGALENICKRTKRKKADVIRLLVNAGIKKGLI